MKEEEIKELKRYLRKKPEEDKKSKHRKEKVDLNPTPYILIFLGFCIGIFLLFILFDKVIMPAYVHGRENVLVPEVVGMKLEKARRVLNEENLDFQVSSKQFSDKYPKNYVLKQSPSPETNVKSGRIVFLTISKGKDSVQVPYIKGRSFRAAKVLLMRKSLETGDTTQKYSKEFSPGVVISQKVKPGQYAHYGQKIDLVISKGPENYIIVPQFTSLKLEESLKLIDELELQRGNIQGMYNNGTWEAYIVDKQLPPPGERVAPGTFIHLWYYRPAK